MDDAEKFIQDLIELGCPHEYCFSDAKAGYAWIVGRLSAYGIIPNGESPEELVFLLKGAKNLIPHVDTSLIKRSRENYESEPAANEFIDPQKDPDLLEGIEGFIDDVIQPMTEYRLKIIYKTSGFRLTIENNSVSSTVMNISSLKPDYRDPNKLICTASFLHLTPSDITELKSEDMPDPNQKGGSGVCSMNSIGFTQALDFLARPEVLEIIVSRAISSIDVINQKYGDDN